MKILFVDQFSEIGGGQRCFLNLLPALEQHGWSVEALLPGNGVLSRRLGASMIPCGPYHSGAKSALDAIRLARDMRGQAQAISGLLSEDRFDLIYVNGPRVLPGSLWGSRWGSRRQIPILFHAHNYLEGFSLRLAGWSLRTGVRSVIACSDFVAAPLRPYVAHNELEVISNGSADLGFRHRSFDTPLNIGIIGRMEPQKGQAEFLRACGHLPGVRLVLCGSPSPMYPEYCERIRRLARGLPVEILGWRDDIAAVMAQLDLIVIPSREGLPLVMLEAFSAGVPVVAYGSGGIPEVLADGETGFLIPDCTEAALAARMGEAISDPERLRKIAAQARLVWESGYDIKRYQDRIMDAMHRAAFGTAIPQPRRELQPQLAQSYSRLAR